MDCLNLKSEIIKRNKALIELIRGFGEADPGSEHAFDVSDDPLGSAEFLLNMVETNRSVFSAEHWHSLRSDGNEPAELLLRIQDDSGKAVAPYPFVMACYNQGLTLQLDVLLLLAALHHYASVLRDHGERQVSVNLSAKFFEARNIDALQIVLDVLERLNLQADIGEAIIFGIHESSASSGIDPAVLEMFSKRGVKFAMDDVVMNAQDVLRFSGFRHFTDFVKLDRSFLQNESDPLFFGGMIDFIRTNAPGSRIVAEGVQDSNHARRLHEAYRHIEFVQGRYLPDRQTFAKEWRGVGT